MKAAPKFAQGDLFAPAAAAVATPPRPAVTPAKRRTVKDSQRASHQRFQGERAATAIARCKAEIAGNWRLGRTRQEIADRTGIKLQTVCGSVAGLLKQGLVFEPVIGFDDRGRPIHWQRDGRNILVDSLYRHTWGRPPEGGHP